MKLGLESFQSNFEKTQTVLLDYKTEKYFLVSRFTRHFNLRFIYVVYDHTVLCEYRSLELSKIDINRAKNVLQHLLTFLR